MDHDAQARHVQNLMKFRDRAEKVIDFVEDIMRRGGVSASGSEDMKQSLASDITDLRRDLTTMQDTIDALEKFRSEVVPVLDQLPRFQEFMSKMEEAAPALEKLSGFDPASIEERLTAVEGTVQDLTTALDPTENDVVEEPASSDGATPGQGAAPVAGAGSPVSSDAPAAETSSTVS